jgi:hypothetical protein
MMTNKKIGISAAFGAVAGAVGIALISSVNPVSAVFVSFPVSIIAFGAIMLYESRDPGRIHFPAMLAGLAAGVSLSMAAMAPSVDQKIDERLNGRSQAELTQENLLQTRKVPNYAIG